MNNIVVLKTPPPTARPLRLLDLFRSDYRPKDLFMLVGTDAGEYANWQCVSLFDGIPWGAPRHTPEEAAEGLTFVKAGPHRITIE